MVTETWPPLWSAHDDAGCSLLLLLLLMLPHTLHLPSQKRAEPPLRLRLRLRMRLRFLRPCRGGGRRRVLRKEVLGEREVVEDLAGVSAVAGVGAWDSARAAVDELPVEGRLVDRHARVASVQPLVMHSAEGHLRESRERAVIEP
jgi:hypothetical protein